MGTLAFLKRRSDPSGHCLSLLDCLSALRAACEVVLDRLPFIADESVEDVIIQRVVRQMLMGKTRSVFLPSDF